MSRAVSHPVATRLLSGPVAGQSRRTLQLRCFPFARFASTGSSIRRTPLYEFHLENKARMVPYGGFEMPLLYAAGGQVAEHTAVRTKAGMFDVGHMVQTVFSGPSATAFLSTIFPSNLTSLAYSTDEQKFSSTLSVILNEKGGILDDCVVTKWDEEKYYVVTNAARRDVDLPWFQSHLETWKKSKGDTVKMEVLEGWGLVALQGPSSAGALQSQLTGRSASYDLETLHFGQSTNLSVGGVDVHVARGGYTGEDGFEISIPPSSSAELAAKLLASSPDISLAGLAARDSLRTEAGLCLYGNDLDEETSPVEAGLTWVIPKDRRKPDAGFIGAEAVAKIIEEGPKRRRVGFLIADGPPARGGAKLFAADGETVIGSITSGIPSPTMKKNIGMGYVLSGYHKKGTEVKVEVRKNLRDAKVTPMPFVKANYWRG